MLKSLRNIQGAFALSRFYLIGITLLSLGVSAYAIFQSYQFAEKQREKVYVLDNGKSLMLALSQDVYMNKPTTLEDLTFPQPAYLSFYEAAAIACKVKVVLIV